MLASYTESTSDKTYLETLANGDGEDGDGEDGNGDDNRFETEILAKRTSILDILLRRPSIKLPFGEFLALLPPLHVRQYSISSSPLANNAANMGVGVGVGVGIGAGAASTTCSTCSITYGVIDTTSLSDPGGAHFEGVAGTYLSSLARGDTVQVSVRPTTNKTFRLPLDPETPLLMFAAGTGIAPFRGFMQQRAVMMAANPDRRMGRALLYLGCRGEGDRLYKEEVDGWVKSGVVDVRYAFSRDKDKEERSDERSERSGGCAAAYVSERMVRDREARDIVGLWRSGARVYVCGSAGFRDSVREAARQIAMVVSEREDREKGVDRSEEERAELGRRWRQELSERVASDVFD
jgi:cytochrome P450/NADPH-cytochrome P450 reductase